MKIRLLNDGGFTGLKSVSFPVIVDAELGYNPNVARVSFKTFMSVPGSFFSEDDNDYGVPYTFLDNEFEVVE